MSRWPTDRWLAPALGACAAVAGLILLLVLAFLLKEAAPLLGSHNAAGFFTDPGWYPLEGQYGMLPMVAASLAVALGAVLLAGPLGLASAIFLNFLAPPWACRGPACCAMCCCPPRHPPWAPASCWAWGVPRPKPQR